MPLRAAPLRVQLYDVLCGDCSTWGRNGPNTKGNVAPTANHVSSTRWQTGPAFGSARDVWPTERNAVAGNGNRHITIEVTGRTRSGAAKN